MKPKKFDEKDLAGYLFVYFKDQDQSAYMAISADGYTFTDINKGQPIFIGSELAEQKGVRDPHITRGPDGAFYLAMTDLHIFGKRAGFRDRVIHHLIYNYISPVFEKTFINDSYSCRKGKGTHYGINRVDHFIRSCSQNYSKDCYILKLDIKGYFMSMNKTLLHQKVKNVLIRNENKMNFDLELVLYLIAKTIFNDPKENCIIKGKKQDWAGLPQTKSLFHAQHNCGLPIGNLT